MKVEKTQSGLYVPSEQPPIKPPKNVHDKSGLQIQPHSYYVKYRSGEAVPDRYILINVYNVRGNGIGFGFHVYPGDNQTWGHFNPRLMTKAQAEERYEYYKEHGFCEYT